MSEVKNKTILLRSDLNDSIENNILQNTERIDSAINSIFNLINNKNKIILTSHLSDNQQSLLPVANYIKKHFTDGEFVFLDTLDKEEIYNFIKNNINNNNNIKVIMLENLRSFHLAVEEKNDDIFAQWLASLAEYFVFDAFSVAHRQHASIISISKYLPHTLGDIAKKEYDNLSEIINNKNNLLVILGGAKISTKLPLIESLINSGVKVVLGGAMANTLLFLKGHNIKDSLIESDIQIKKEILNNTNIILLQDLNKDYIWQNNMIMDINADSLEYKIKDILEENNIKDIFWNGPFGVCEKGFDASTNKIIQILNNDKYKDISVAGGGDTLTAIKNWEISNKDKFNIKYISLSGGAALTFLERGTLVGIDANK